MVSPPTVPAWCPWLLHFQMGVVYVFVDVAKLDREFLLGRPFETDLRLIATMLPDRRDTVYTLSYSNDRGLEHPIWIRGLRIVYCGWFYASVPSAVSRPCQLD